MFRSLFVTTLILCVSALAAPAQSTDEFHMDETYAIGSGGTIDLQSDDAQVRIVGSNRSDVRVKVDYELEIKGFRLGSGDHFQMIVEERGGNLRIREKPREFQSRGVFGSMREEYTILIEAPRNVSLRIEGDDETYEISGIDGRLDLDADDTEITIRDCGGDFFAFDMDDGSLDMDEGRGELRLRLDDGDFEIGRGNFTSVRVEADDADMSITTALADNGRYRFDMDDSELNFTIAGGGGTFEVRHDNGNISAGGPFERIMHDDHISRYRLQGGSARVEIETDDGRIRFRVL